MAWGYKSGGWKTGLGSALDDRGDIFNSGDSNPWNGSYLIKFVLLFSLPILFLYIAQGVVDGIGGIYIPILLLGFFGTYIAYIYNKIPRNKPRLKMVFYGKDRTPGGVFVKILAGLIYGGALLFVSSAGTLSVFGIGNSFSIGNALVPYSVTQSISLPPLLQEIVIGNWAPVMEELLFASLLVATLADLDVPITFAFAAFISLAFPNLFSLTVVLGVIAVIVAFNPPLRKFFEQKRAISGAMARFALAISFGLMHVYAYGNKPDITMIMIGAMLFAFFGYLIDWKLQSAVPSLVAHSMLNLFAEAAILSLPNGWIVATIFTAVTVGIIMYFPLTEARRAGPVVAASYRGVGYVQPT